MPARKAGSSKAHTGAPQTWPHLLRGRASRAEVAPQGGKMAPRRPSNPRVFFQRGSRERATGNALLGPTGGPSAQKGSAHTCLHQLARGAGRGKVAPRGGRAGRHWRSKEGNKDRRRQQRLPQERRTVSKPIKGRPGPGLTLGSVGRSREKWRRKQEKWPRPSGTLPRHESFSTQEGMGHSKRP